MSRTKIDRSQRAIFGARFSEQLKTWQSAGKNRRQEDFGKLIDPPASRVSVGRWCTGKDIPTPERLKQICEIFKVDEDYFDMTNATHDELYKNSGLFQTKIGKAHVEFAKEINLNLDLVEALSKVVNFDELFPLYSPIRIKEKTGLYNREVNYINAPTMEKENDLDKDLQFLQVEQKGIRITLHRCDLAFLKEVQDQIVTFTEYLFYRREKEKAEEVDAFNHDLLDQNLIEITVDGDLLTDYGEKEKYLNMLNEKPKQFESDYDFEEALTSFFSKSPKGKSICIKQKKIPEDFILNHDRFAKYNMEKRFTKYYMEKKEATQADWDRLFEGDVTLKDGGKGKMKEGK